TRAELSPDGKHYILNGSKIWISNGGTADVMTVFARTKVTNPKTGKVDDKVSAFIVERGFGGVTSGPPEKKLGIKCSNTTAVSFLLLFKNLFCFASEAAWYVCDEAIQILGGMGFMKETGLERILRDLRIFRIFEGTNDILRLFVALTGIQYSGAHLRELQSAFKNPTANLGLIFEEASKRVGRKVGLSSPPSMDHLVHRELIPSSQVVARSVDSFGQAVEMLLIKYGKNIVNEQCVLNRLANAAFDIYSSTVVLSRASQSLKENSPTANHEKLMTEAWILEATDRVKANLDIVASGKYLDNFSKMSAISRTVCQAEGVAQTNPLKL
uniref:Very long-chain specific acyl-CoA dehydrogenase, mitochondrial n=1 Tax=Diabrotica virgifera virgifera TaxID=50390 RepID=A0A6P7GU87_DIAVI